MTVKIGMALCCLSLLLCFVMVSSDRLDTFQTKMAAVDASNCASKSTADLTISEYQRGSGLIDEAKKLALNRAIFYSITNQKLDTFGLFDLQPDLYYTYLSVAVSLASSPRGVLATGLYYDQNTYYPNFYLPLPFNSTLKLFAPYASHGMRPAAIKVKDDSVRNYTDPVFLLRTGEWFKQWFPDPYDTWRLTKDILTTVNSTSNAEQTFYSVRLSNPAKVTQPYFDCGRTNKWIVTVSSPVVDYLPRYSLWRYLRRHRFVAVATVDVDYTLLDINQCDIPYYNSFYGTHKCKPSTECQPLRGFGFRRGGYKCVCKQGYKYPENGDQVPYRGNRIESATDLEYSTGFECVQSTAASASEASSSTNPLTWVTPDLAQTVLSVTPSNCTSDGPAMVLPTVPTWYIRRELTAQIRPGFRLAQLISGSLQQRPDSPGPDFLIEAPHDVNTNLLAAEIEAIVFSDDKIAAAEVVLEREYGQMFSYFAKRSVDDGGNVNALKLNGTQNRWTSEMFDARRAEVWIGGPVINRNGIQPPYNMFVNSSMKPIPNAPLLKEMTPWMFQGPDDVHMEKPEYSCDVNSWVEKVSSAIIGPDSQSNPVIRGEVIVYVALPMPSLI